MKFVNVNYGNENVNGEFSAGIENAKVEAANTVEFVKAGVEIETKVRLKPRTLGEMIKPLIKGEIDDKIIDLVVGALEKAESLGKSAEVPQVS